MLAMSSRKRGWGINHEDGSAQLACGSPQSVKSIGHTGTPDCRQRRKILPERELARLCRLFRFDRLFGRIWHFVRIVPVDEKPPAGGRLRAKWNGPEFFP